MVAVYIKLLEDYEVMTAEEIAKRDGIKHRLVTTRLDRLRDYGFIAKVNSRVIDPTTVTVRAGMGGISISDETIAAVLELRASGMTYREIARKLNIALNTAWRTFVANDKP
jgi:predicted transcriptional regulator